MDTIHGWLQTVVLPGDRRPAGSKLSAPRAASPYTLDRAGRSSAGAAVGSSTSRLAGFPRYGGAAQGMVPRGGLLQGLVTPKSAVHTLGKSGAPPRGRGVSVGDRPRSAIRYLLRGSLHACTTKTAPRRVAAVPPTSRIYDVVPTASRAAAPANVPRPGFLPRGLWGASRAASQSAPSDAKEAT